MEGKGRAGSVYISTGGSILISVEGVHLFSLFGVEYASKKPVLLSQ
jgi:hypothetical protein